jgi:hypothetical protein
MKGLGLQIKRDSVSAVCLDDNRVSRKALLIMVYLLCRPTDRSSPCFFGIARRSQHMTTDISS